MARMDNFKFKFFVDIYIYHIQPIWNVTYVMYYDNIITCLLCFFPGFDRFTLVWTDSSRVSTDSSLLAFLLLEPSPLQSKCTLVNKTCIVLYFDIILFYIIWNKHFFIKKETSSLLRSNIFLKNTVDTNPRLSPSQFNATDCRLWSTGNDRNQSSVVHSMQMAPSEIAVVQIGQTEYIMKCYHNMVDQIPPKCSLWPWNLWESHCLHQRPHIWNSRTSGASHHQNTRELPLEQKLNFHESSSKPFH